MSERIAIKSDFLGGNTNRFSINTQSNTDGYNDVRYSGIVDKPRFHPRLIIRKFRSTNLTSTSALSNINPIELNNFVLTEADESVEEKFQIVQTFGPDFVFFYGPKPRVFNYSGILFNTQEKPWATEWQRAWDNPVPNQTAFPSTPDDPTDMVHGSQDTQKSILSGTNVVLQGGIVRLEYDGCYGFSSDSGATIGPNGSGAPFTGNKNPNNVVLVREGYLIRFSVRRTGSSPNAAAFNMSMLVTNRMDF